jgi:hypothetical protein
MHLLKRKKAAMGCLARSAIITRNAVTGNLAVRVRAPATALVVAPGIPIMLE